MSELKIDPIGGQAVIEGVMMRGSRGVCVAVRTPTGEISLKQVEVESWRERYPALKLPFVRGVAALVESMVVGIRMMNFSAAVATGENPDKPGGLGSTLSLVLGLGLAILLFKYVPAVVFEQLKPVIENRVALNALEGVVRMALFMAYLLGISMLPEVKRLFQYHGAEHQVINCLEAGKEVTAEEAMRFSPIHPRCGTSFLLITLVMSIVVFTFINPDLGAWARTGTKLALLPVVAGISFELIRLAGEVTRRGNEAGWIHRLAWWLTSPGMLLQRVTTRPASQDQIEVAIASLRGALAMRPGIQPVP